MGCRIILSGGQMAPPISIQWLDVQFTQPSLRSYFLSRRKVQNKMNIRKSDDADETCSALELYKHNVPQWINIPCYEPLLDSWVCKRHTVSHNDIRYDSEQVGQHYVKTCDKGYHLVNSTCYKLCYKNRLCHCSNDVEHGCKIVVKLYIYYLEYLNAFYRIDRKLNPSISDIHIYHNYNDIGCCIQNISKISNCRPGHFQCLNNECISDFYVCDGKNDCPHGEDEEGCTCQIPASVEHC